MSDTVTSRDGDEEDGAKFLYEAPILKPIGNVRDLLAGGQGSGVDAPPDPELPGQFLG